MVVKMESNSKHSRLGLILHTISLVGWLSLLHCIIICNSYIMVILLPNQNNNSPLEYFFAFFLYAHKLIICIWIVNNPNFILNLHSSKRLCTGKNNYIAYVVWTIFAHTSFLIHGLACMIRIIFVSYFALSCCFWFCKKIYYHLWCGENVWNEREYKENSFFFWKESNFKCHMCLHAMIFKS